VDDNGQRQEEAFDMVVLSTGLEINRDAVALSNTLGIETDKYHFAMTDSFHPVATSVPGIYACGAFTGPKDIPQSVMEASAAACGAAEKLAAACNTLTREVEIPEPRDISRQKPRIGVFVCNCGINIGGIVRVPEVAEYSRSLPGVEYVEENLFTCSQDTQDKMIEIIRNKDLNRVVVAACTPRTHETLFQETLMNAGLNKYLVEMANIRNQDSWVHSDNPDAATEKAKDLVRMSVAKITFSKPLLETDLQVNRSALVVGGGVAGMTAALSIARRGFQVHLVEKSKDLGGNARLLNKTYRGENIQVYLENLTTDVMSDKRITVHRKTTVRKVDGFVGNFISTLTDGQSAFTVEHGVAILAGGAREHRPKEYLYGEHPAVVTHLELDAMLKDDASPLERSKDVVFIQCVGSRNKEHPYCSKVCCTHSISSALELKKRNPELSVYILYRDIRTYGQREALYQEARRSGIFFFRYDPDNPPQVCAAGEKVSITFEDSIIGRRLRVDADILCLASAIESYHDHALARNFKVSMDADGWLLEAHQKLRPVEFANEGIFLCGMAHYPKPIEETIAQAMAAASRAMTVLTRENIMVGGIVAHIDAELCSGCLGCINVCPFAAITINHDKKTAEVNPALCKGCGACAAACPSEAPTLMGFSNRQMYAQIKSLLAA
jgi:heterodisulfide reductase subunit A